MVASAWLAMYRKTNLVRTCLLEREKQKVRSERENVGFGLAKQGLKDFSSWKGGFLEGCSLKGKPIPDTSWGIPSEIRFLFRLHLRRKLDVKFAEAFCGCVSEKRGPA